MKKFIISLVTFCITSFLSAQEKKVIGEKLDGSPIEGEVFRFDNVIGNINSDDSLRYVCVQLRNTTKSGKYLKWKGWMELFDTQTNQSVWKINYNYNSTPSTATITPNGLLITQDDSHYHYASMYDLRNGDYQWSKRFTTIAYDEEEGTLRGFKNFYSNTYSVISMQDGMPLWEVEIPHNQCYYQSYAISKDSVIIIADDLHIVNIKTGQTTSADLKIGTLDITNSIFNYGISMARTTSNLVPGDNKHYVTEMVSNLCIKDSLLYIADAEGLKCFDLSLNAIWKTEIPDASFSRINVENDKIHMVNYGFGIKSVSNKLVKRGKPFFATFNRNNGELLFFKQLSPKKEMIEDAIATDDAFYILFDDGLIYQQTNDSTSSKKEWDVKQYGKLKQLLPELFFSYNNEEGTFEAISYDGANCPVYSDNEKIYIVNNELEILQEYSMDSIYFPVYELQDYYLIHKDFDLWIVNEIGMPVAQLSVNPLKVIIRGNKMLLLTDEKEIIKFDLDEAIN